MKILIIEDEPELPADLSAQANLCEYAVIWAQAREKVELYRCECILLDLMLPGGDGPDSLVSNMINVLDKVQPGFSFTQATAPSPDSSYTLIRFDTFMNDREQFRCLTTDIRVNGTLLRVLIENLQKMLPTGCKPH